VIIAPESTITLRAGRRPPPQSGFTLVEVAIVLVIVGLLLGAMLKGQELVRGAQVKSLVSQQDGIRAAFLAFVDRFGAPPGDYAGASTHLSCRTVCLNGNGNGRIESAAAPANGSEAREDLLAWTHLSAASFLTGEYFMTPGAVAPSDSNSPKNPHGVYLQIAYDANFGLDSGDTSRHNIKTGNQIPVSILAEVDHKFDDGRPHGGSFQFSVYTAPGGIAPTGNGGAASCVSAQVLGALWNAASGLTNCGAASLL
jgi:prepilin-type N-terminal cleavage/methylation domain-containing protein